MVQLLKGKLYMFDILTVFLIVLFYNIEKVLKYLVTKFLGNVNLKLFMFIIKYLHQLFIYI